MRMPELNKSAPGATASDASGATTGTAQLTYTSYDGGSGRGGWRIKEVVGDLSYAERDSLVERVQTKFDLEPRLPEFPTEGQIESRPARLSYASLGEHGVYWHTVDAGRDATGRPGNVFAHMALDRRPVTDRSVRPITRWGSPDWLRPYGPPAVTAAELAGPELPHVGPGLDVNSIVDFLISGDIDRQGVARVLLDAVHQALIGGPAVVVLTGDHHTSARWIAAISYFLPVAAAQQFSWTTHDRPDSAGIDIGRGMHLVAMPRESFTDSARIGDAVVIDDAEEPDLGGRGTDHSTSRGTVPVGRLSLLAEGVLADEELAVRVLGRRDEIAAEVGASGTTFVWPLAAAVHEEAELEEYHDEALRAIADDAPDSLGDAGWAADLITRAQLVHPLTPDQLFVKLVTAHQSSQPTGVLAARFLEVMLQMPDWTSSGLMADRIPMLQTVELGPFRTAIEERIARLVAARARFPSTTTLGEGLLLAEVIHRLARRDADFDAILPSLDAMLDPADVEVFWGRLPWPASLRGGVVSPSVCARWVRPLLARYSHAELLEITADVWQWVYDDVPLRRGMMPVPANPIPEDMWLYPIGIAKALAAGVELRDPDPDGRQWRVDAALDMALGCREAITDDQCRALTGELLSHVPLTIPELLPRSREYPTRLASQSLRDPVLSGPYDADLFRRIVDIVRAGHRPEPEVCSAAVLRQWYRRPEAVSMTREELLDHTAAVLEAGPMWIRAYPDDLAVPVCTGFVIGQLSGRQWADLHGQVGSELRARCMMVVDQLPRWLHLVVRLRLIETKWLVAHSFLYALDPSLVPAVLFDRDEREPGWADVLVGEMVAAGVYDGPATEEGLRDLTWPRVRRADAASAEAFFANYRRAGREWLRELKIPGADSGRRIIRGLNREETR